MTREDLTEVMFFSWKPESCVVVSHAHIWRAPKYKALRWVRGGLPVLGNAGRPVDWEEQGGRWVREEEQSWQGGERLCRAYMALEVFLRLYKIAAGVP